MSKLITHIKRLALTLCLATPLVSRAVTTYSTYKDDTDTPRSGAFGNAGYQRFQLNATWMFNIEGTDIASTADAVSLDSIKVYWHSSPHGNADIGTTGTQPDPYLVVTTPQKVIVGISAVGEKWSADGSSTFAFTGLTISPNAQYYYYFATNVSGLEVGGVLSGNGAQARFTGTWHGSAKTSDTTVCVMDDGRYSIRCDFAVSEATSTVLTTTTEGVSLTTGTDPVFVKGAVADGVVNVDSEVAVPSLTVAGEATTLKLADTLTATYLYLPATTTIDASEVTLDLPGDGETTKETVLVAGKISSAADPSVTLPSSVAEGYNIEPLVRDDSGIKVVVTKPTDATVTFTSGSEVLNWSEVKPEGWVNSEVPMITIDNSNFAGTLVFDEDVQAAKIVLPGGWAANIKRSAGVTVDIPYFSCPNNYANHTFTDFEAIPQTVQATTSADKIYVSGTETLISFPQISTANQCADISIAQKATLSGTGDGGGFYVRGTKSVNINSGADISATRFVLGNDGNTTQTVTQNGGAVTVTGTAAPTSNQASILLGHWNSTVTLKTLGGTFTANNVASRLGWDGTATWQIGGGSSDARVNVYGIVNGGNGHAGAGTLNIMANGTLNLGAGGVNFNNGSNSGNINLAGGTISAGADAVTITNAKDGGTIINQGKETTINVGGARTLTVNAVLSGQGVGTLTKTGTGTMILAKTATTKGKLLVSEGTVKFNEGISWGSNGTVEVGANGTLDVLTAEAVAEGALLVAGSYTVNGTVLNNGSAIDVDVKNDGIYRAIPTVTVTVPPVANTMVNVVSSEGDVVDNGDGTYTVLDGSTVTVTYSSADYEVTGGTFEFTASEGYTVDTTGVTTTPYVAQIKVGTEYEKYTSVAQALTSENVYRGITLLGNATEGTLNITQQYVMLTGAGYTLTADITVGASTTFVPYNVTLDGDLTVNGIYNQMGAVAVTGDLTTGDGARLQFSTLGTDVAALTVGGDIAVNGALTLTPNSTSGLTTGVAYKTLNGATVTLAEGASVTLGTIEGAILGYVVEPNETTTLTINIPAAKVGEDDYHDTFASARAAAAGVGVITLLKDVSSVVTNYNTQTGYITSIVTNDLVTIAADEVLKINANGYVICVGLAAGLTPPEYALSTVMDGNVAIYSVIHGVAVIGNKPYPSLAAALAAAQDGDTVTLLSDANMPAVEFADKYGVPSAQGDSEIIINKAITLDGAGHTIYGVANYFTHEMADGCHDLFISGDKDVVIKNVTLSDFGGSAYVSKFTYPIWTGQGYTGTLVLDGVTVTNYNRTAFNFNGGTVVVTNCAVYGDAPAPRNVNGAYFQNGIGVLNANVTVYDSAFTGIGAYDPDHADSNSAECFQVVGAGSITVKSGSYAGQYIAIVGPDASGTIAIADGDFSGDLCVEEGSSGGISLTGGTYDSDVDGFCASGYKATKSSSEPYTWTVELAGWSDVETGNIDGVTTENQEAVETVLESIKTELAKATPGADETAVAAWLTKVYGGETKVPAATVAAAKNVDISVAFDLPLMTASKPEVEVDEGAADGTFTFQIMDGETPVDMTAATEKVLSMVKYTADLDDDFGPATATQVGVAVAGNTATVTMKKPGGATKGFMKIVLR